jgi:hypothetical protein
MRALREPFNLPSVEGLILQFYTIVDPLDAHTPTEGVLDGTEAVFVDPVDPVGHALAVQWFLDGEPVAEAVGDTLELGALDLTVGPHVLQATVTDRTALVRDETARAALMTRTVAWAVEVRPLAPVSGEPSREPLSTLDILPNPFNPRTTVRFTLPAAGNVQAVIYDVRGRLVARLVDGRLDAGVRSYEWGGTDIFGRALPSGTYFCRLSTPWGTGTRKLVLLR